jgi:hypothetical protein
MAFKIINANIIDDSRNIINAATVGINTSSTPTAQRLWVEGAGYFSGIASASQLVSNAAQGTAPISVGSSTLVTNLNSQYLNSQPGSFYQIANNLTGTAPGSVISQSSGLTITGNLSVSGNVSVSGTSFLLYAGQLQVQDRDIVLGITTDANGIDISKETGANHGGISIASTEGTPLINIPLQAGINSNPATYKQWMWIRSGNYTGLGTDAWVSNYAVSIGNTATVQNGSRLTVGAGFTVYDTYIDILDIRARNITAVTNINASGVTTSGGVNVTTGNTYQINGASVLSNNTLGSGVVNSSLTSVGTLGILNVTGSTTSGSLSVTGVTTSGGVNVTTGNDYKINGTSVLSNNTLGSGVVNSSLTSVGTLGILNVTGVTTSGLLNVTGVTTSGGVNVTTGNDYKINGTSVLTSTTLGSAVVNSSLTSVGTLGILNVTGSTTSGSLSVTGVTTSGGFNATTGNDYKINATSVLTSTTLGSAVVNSSLTSVGTLGLLNVTGVTTSGGVNVTAGNDYKINGTSVLTSTTLGSAVVNSSLTSVGTLPTLNATNITNTNINSSGINTAAQYYVGTTKIHDTIAGQVTLSGIATIDATTRATLERELAFAPNDFDSLNVSGISTLRSTTLIGGGTSTGTANQVLQVTGISSGAYIGGSLGIGVTLPSTPLDVNGSVRFRTSITDNSNATGSANQVLTAGPTGAGVTWATLNASAVGAISAVTVTNDTSTSTPLFPIFTSSTGSNITGVSVDSVGLTYIPSGAGSLGIGTISPTRNLDVNGEVRLRAGLYDSTNQLGSLNQVLSVGAGGSVTWQAVTSVGAIAGINVSQDDTGIRYPLLASGTNATTTAQYVDATALVYNTLTNCLGIGSLTPTSRLDIIGDVRVSGIVTATDFDSRSDRNLKTNIEVISNPIEKVLQISGVNFNWKENGKASMGVIAQEVEVVLPELVSNTDPKTVNYNGLIGLLIECVKDQQNQIDELKKITAKKTTRKPKNT